MSFLPPAPVSSETRHDDLHDIKGGNSMKLREISMRKLLGLHNEIAAKPAGPKTFATRDKLIARIESLADAKNIDLAWFSQPGSVRSTEPRAQPHVKNVGAVANGTKLKSKRGNGVGELAISLILNPAGYPYCLIALTVNAERPGAAATVNSIRWYASKMRKLGAEVPERQMSNRPESTPTSPP